MAVAEVFWPTLGKPVLGCFQTEPGLQAGWYFYCRSVASHHRHPGEGRDLSRPEVCDENLLGRIPAYAGMTRVGAHDITAAYAVVT